ncbi:hypothetical protein DFH09DRAFT_1425823 [Mycena vulgaris]|nr:hypothetical protein DFH09DRAFT_1425823 [Mycena vulgaris]
MSHAWRPGSFKGSQNNVPYEFADLPQSRSSDPNRPTGVNPATTNTHSRSQSHICILPAAYHLPREHLANQRHATTSHDMQQHHRRAGSTTGTAVPKTRGTMNGRGCRPAAEGEGGRRGRECGGNVARNTGRIILFPEGIPADLPHKDTPPPVLAAEGTARIQRAFRCRICPAIDHPTPLCPLPSLPGWLGPTPATIAAHEEASRTAAAKTPEQIRTNNFGAGSSNPRSRNVRGQGAADSKPRKDGKGKRGGDFKGKGKRRERYDFF